MPRSGAMELNLLAAVNLKGKRAILRAKENPWFSGLPGGSGV
jgi:hypothetical protein